MSGDYNRGYDMSKWMVITIEGGLCNEVMDNRGHDMSKWVVITIEGGLILIVITELSVSNHPFSDYIK